MEISHPVQDVDVSQSGISVGAMKYTSSLPFQSILLQCNPIHGGYLIARLMFGFTFLFPGLVGACLGLILGKLADRNRSNPASAPWTEL